MSPRTKLTDTKGWITLALWIAPCVCWVRRLSGSLWVYVCVVAVLEEIAAFALWRGTADCCEVRSQFRSCVAAPCMSHWIWWNWVKGETAGPSHLTASLFCWWWVEDESKSKKKERKSPAAWQLCPLGQARGNDQNMLQGHLHSVHKDKVKIIVFQKLQENLHANQISFSIFQVISRVCDLLITDTFKCLIYLKHTQFFKISWDLVWKVIPLLSLV